MPLVLPLYGGGDDIQAIAMDSERVVVTLQLQTLLDAGHERIAFATLDSAHRLTTASRQLLLPEVGHLARHRAATTPCVSRGS